MTAPNPYGIHRMNLNMTRLFLTLTIVSFSVFPGTDVVAQKLTETNYDQLVPAGKETDAIYGDFALVNKSAKAVIASPLAARHANMTVRSVRGCLLDFANSSFESDQLSAFYPGKRKFPFTASRSHPNALVVVSPATEKRPRCEVRYEFKSDLPVIDVTTTWTNTTASDWAVELQDDMRIDVGKEDTRKSPNGKHDLFYVNDIFWQQAYGIRAPGYSIQSNSNARNSVLVYKPISGDIPAIKPGESFTLLRQIIVAQNLVDVFAIADQLSGDKKLAECQLLIIDGNESPVANARIELRQDKKLRGILQADENGMCVTRLRYGTYSAVTSVAGIKMASGDITVGEDTEANKFKISSNSYRAGTVKASITDGDGKQIPAKIEFLGHDKTPTPNWGPDTAEHFVRNLAYTENGEFSVPLQQGVYNVIVSHGPEYDAVFTRLTVEAGKTADLKASLKHSVQTDGWVSSDFHSHSSPSGDNTGSQRGRVLNLAAENIDFAPCTEHNRVSTYSGHIRALGLQRFLATVSGIELTGQPLPLNHQNVFPMLHVPRTQDGGGPVTDTNPETQIERLTLWDSRSEKLVQQNHPDIGWLFYDKNGDGTPDDGYWRSFRLMDVMEIHPIDRVLNINRYEVRDGQPKANQRIFNWLQLLNQGYRIYGVVNTDAHYNFHGSGWLRNWIQSTTDDPAKIDPLEMVHASEQGRLIMSNGPFLEATFREAGSEKSVVSGQDIEAQSGNIVVDVRVQCPDWFDIDTVFLLINGREVDDFRFTRADNPESFGDGVVKFEKQLEITLEKDSHIIVVAGHQRARLGAVMGPSGGGQHPAALTNPVFVDVDGNGFTPNKDTLGHPLPVKFGAK